ncbi:pyroglutamyl-peptidase I [Clostridiaceae bacterium M8S5]|nr:pyroglutamyl-peptidase I [Clostridiaceae bacterium M8S5]
MKKVLITGFDPFGGESVNPALEAVKKLPDMIMDYNIVKLEVPTVFKKSIDTLKKAIIKESPDIVLCIGQAGGRFTISIERIAINLDNARIPDNEENQPVDTPIYKEGKNAYFSNLPINAILKKLSDNNIPANISNTAGTFVCNHLMYGLLHMIENTFDNIKGGFIHVPYLPDQVIGRNNVASMSLENIVTALRLIIEASIENNKDIALVTGKTH